MQTGQSDPNISRVGPKHSSASRRKGAGARQIVGVRRGRPDGAQDRASFRVVPALGACGWPGTLRIPESLQTVFGSAARSRNGAAHDSIQLGSGLDVDVAEVIQHERQLRQAGCRLDRARQLARLQDQIEGQACRRERS